MFTKLLIANRGEIAVRIIRACKEMGIEAAAVYSEADAEALHVREADEAVFIGPAAPAESYLHTARILEAAHQTGAQAVHPGYGFLAENAAFARAVEAAGLVFVGPSPAAIQAMGNKAEARALMQAAGVPIVPGYQGLDDGLALIKAAGEIGYPVLVKAAAGGGGRGMRVVWEPDDLPEELAAARREAHHAFQDERLILEKYIPRARHIEFQVFGDRYGKILHLFERECSIQRRYQKIIEESPSPLVDTTLREEMGAAAVAAAGAVGYENAGTVEFIVDPDSRVFYFLEMNTRLQVEHPVTELVTGLDLVEWQLRVAAGEALSFEQTDLTQRGHALECRIYAENPADQFLPTAGRLFQLVTPQGPGIRVDSGVASGDAIGTAYDPLLAKVIVQGEDRPAAIRRMQAALQEMVLLGLTTNLAFLRAVLAHPEFQAGRATTQFLERNFSAWVPPEHSLPPAALIAAALIELQPQDSRSSAEAGPDPHNPWQGRDGFRLGGGRS
jgi:acetyl-CoA carboxylase biotin carboxylase subunit